ncbi:hypothetical protein LTR17_018601 [Elasticomyces elasticus]|nr:hypothetical protein LTR17_018601 [Elasticomyces elasticus]
MLLKQPSTVNRRSECVSSAGQATTSLTRAVDDSLGGLTVRAPQVAACIKAQPSFAFPISLPLALQDCPHSMAPTTKVLWDQPNYWVKTDLTYYVDRLDLIELLESKWPSTTVAGVKRQYYQVENDRARNHRVYASEKLSEVSSSAGKREEAQLADDGVLGGYQGSGEEAERQAGGQQRRSLWILAI